MVPNGVPVASQPATAPVAFCLDAQPAEDLAVLVSRGAIANGGKGAPEWLRRALRSNGFVCLSRTPDRLLSVVIGESFLKEVQLPDDVEVERQWTALRLDKAALDPSAALSSFTALCQTVQAAGLTLHAVSTPDSEHLLLQVQQLPVMLHALLGVGHAVAPAGRVCPSLPSGLVCRNDRCRALRGAWGLARRERPAGTVIEEHSHGKGPVRLQAACGLFAEVRIASAEIVSRSQASCFGCLEVSGSGGGGSSSTVRRHRIVDFQPPTGEDLRAEVEVEGAVLVESGLPSGRCRETWQRVEASHDTVAMELLSESPGRGVQRQGCWLFCGRLFVRILGLPRGHGVVASTCCGSLEQLQRLKGEAAIQAEISDHYEAMCGTVEKPGVLKVTQQAGAGADRQGTAFLDLPSGTGGAITSLSRSEVVHLLPDGTEQRWRVLEWGFNPFSERELSPAASQRSVASASSAAKKKKKKAARSGSRSMSISGSTAREKKKKKKDKEKDKDKKKKKDKDKAGSSDDEDKEDKKKKKEKDKEKKDEKKKKEKKEDRSRSRSKAKKDRSASPEDGGKKKKKDKKDKKDKKGSRSRSRSRSGEKKKKKKKDASASRSRSRKKDDDDSSAEQGAAKAATIAELAAAEAAGATAELFAAQAHQQTTDSRPSNFPITISFRSGQTGAKPEVKDGKEQMLRKSEVHAHQIAAAGALFARASQAKAPKNDPAPAPPPELLAAPPANASSSAKAAAAGSEAPAEDPSSAVATPAVTPGNEGETPAASAPAEQASAEQEDVPMEEDTAEEDTKELPASFPFPKGYPPPREDGLPANFPFPKGYPPPPDQPGMLPLNFLYPKGYPPPPETEEVKTVQLTPPGQPPLPGMPLPPPPGDPNAPQLLVPSLGAYGDPSAAAALLAAPPPPPPGGAGLLAPPALPLLTPPPPPGDPNAAPLVLPQIDPTTGLLLPPPPGVPGSAAGVPPPPPGMPVVGAQQPSGSDPVTAFLVDNKIDTRAAGAIRLLPLDLQLKVVAEGPVSGTNPSAVLTARIRKLELQAGKAAGTAPGVDAGTSSGAAPPPPPNAMLPPGAIGPQPAPGVGDAAQKADPPPPPSLLPPGLTAAQILQLGLLAPGTLPPPGLPGAPGAAAGTLAGALPAHLLAGTMPALGLAGKLPALGLPALPAGLTAPALGVLPGAPPPVP